jgi:hypothetical protein
VPGWSNGFSWQKLAAPSPVLIDGRVTKSTNKDSTSSPVTQQQQKYANSRTPSGATIFFFQVTEVVTESRIKHFFTFYFLRRHNRNRYETLMFNNLAFYLGYESHIYRNTDVQCQSDKRN